MKWGCVISIKDIIETAIAAGTFKTLAAALTSADLLVVLKGAGPFTVFAPTDDAFSKLPSGTIENLLKPENKDKLISILKYHVMAGKLDADSVASSKELHSLFGNPLFINTKNGKVHIGGATVTAADIMAVNGVIYVIDEVLIPE
ncbi:MAG: fasciclin domain-containing protein [Negativicutes bacterium]|nr:fasciclin domain-containing protein [Negativicutes bacterium]